MNTIRLDKKHHEKAFKRMEKSMFMAMNGRDATWAETNYKANIAGQHVKNKTAAIYAKNPKVVARRKDTLDFLVWDETQQSLMIAMQLYQQGLAQQMAASATAQAEIDPATGEAVVPAPPPIPASPRPKR